MHDQLNAGPDAPGSRSATGSGAEVLNLLRQQRDLCVRLARLAEQQRQLITGDQPEQLLGVLASRQSLLEQLEAVASGLRPYQRAWRATRAQMDAATGSEADRLVAEVNTLLGDILRSDAADAELLSARRTATARQMAEVRQTRQAGHAYAAAAAVTGTAVDWTAE